MVETKRCGKCDEIRPLEDFRKDYRAKDRDPEKRRSQCRGCEARYRKLKRDQENAKKELAKKEFTPQAPILGIKVPMSELEYQRRLRAAENMR